MSKLFFQDVFFKARPLILNSRCAFVFGCYDNATSAEKTCIFWRRVLSWKNE